MALDKRVLLYWSLNSEPSGDDQLRLRGIHHAEQVGHLEFRVGQGDCLVEELDRSLQVAALHLERAQRLVSELALLVELDRLLDEVGGFADVTAPLEVTKAAVNEDVGIGGVDL